jgi:hypothetical protein
MLNSFLHKYTEEEKMLKTSMLLNNRSCTANILLPTAGKLRRDATAISTTFFSF